MKRRQERYTREMARQRMFESSPAILRVHA